MGAACVQALHRAGGKVVIADVNPATGEALAGELGDRVRFVRTDVTDPASVEGAIQVALTEFGGLQGVVNCAGVAIAEKVVGPHASLPAGNPAAGYQQVVEALRFSKRHPRMHHRIQ